MNLFDVLTSIREAGGRVVVEDGDLEIFAPPGVLTEEAAVVLKEHKPDLIKILPSAEREAIQWIEDLDPQEAEIVLKDAFEEWDKIVSNETWPDPCTQCGSLHAWETVSKRWRCMRCDPPTKAQQWLNKAERLRRRYGIKEA